MRVLETLVGIQGLAKWLHSIEIAHGYRTGHYGCPRVRADELYSGRTEWRVGCERSEPEVLLNNHRSGSRNDCIDEKCISLLLTRSWKTGHGSTRRHSVDGQLS